MRMPTGLRPAASKREMILPMTFEETPSGLMMERVRSVVIVAARVTDARATVNAGLAVLSPAASPMDLDLVTRLEAAGLTPNPEAISVGIPREADRLVLDDGPAVLVDDRERTLKVELKPLSVL